MQAEVAFNLERFILERDELRDNLRSAEEAAIRTGDYVKKLADLLFEAKCKMYKVLPSEKQARKELYYGNIYGASEIKYLLKDGAFTVKLKDIKKKK